MSRILPKTDYRDGEILYGSDLNASNDVIKAGVDDNFELIEGLDRDKVGNDTFNEALALKADTAYVDEELAGKVDTSTYTQKINEIETDLQDNYVNNTVFNPVKDDVTGLKNGTVKAEKSTTADHLSGVSTAETHSYYGTDYSGNEGFFKVPDAIFAEDVADTSAISVDGIYYEPHDNSVSEQKLTAEVRTKLNRASVTDYDQLTNRPSINSVVLTGNKSSSDLGLQPAGNYLTEVPSTYVQRSELSAYATTNDLNTSISSVTDAMDELDSYVRETYAVVQVGSSFVGTPKTGDILITL
jgi:hypothetical protein